MHLFTLSWFNIKTLPKFRWFLHNKATYLKRESFLDSFIVVITNLVKQCYAMDNKLICLVSTSCNSCVLFLNMHCRWLWKNDFCINLMFSFMS